MFFKDYSCKVMLTSGKSVFECSVADTFFTKLTGLMFKRRYPARALLFKDCFWMHSFFCFVNFHIVFLDENFNIIETFYNVSPNKILPPVWGSKYVIEFWDDTKFIKGQKLLLEGV